MTIGTPGDRQDGATVNTGHGQYGVNPMPRPPADPTLKMVSVRLSEATRADLDAIAVAHGKDRTWAIGHAASVARHAPPAPDTPPADAPAPDAALLAENDALRATVAGLRADLDRARAPRPPAAVPDRVAGPAVKPAVVYRNEIERTRALIQAERDAKRLNGGAGEVSIR